MGVSQQQMSERIAEATEGLAVPTSFHGAVSLMSELVSAETVSFFMATRGVGGGGGQVTVDIVALTERRLVEIEFYAEKQRVRVYSFGLDTLVSAGLSTEGTPTGERMAVYASRRDGRTSEWSGGEDVGEDLRCLAAHLLQRAAG